MNRARVQILAHNTKNNMDYRFMLRTYYVTMSKKTHQPTTATRHLEYFDTVTDAVSYLVHGAFERGDNDWSITDRKDDEVIASGRFNEVGAPVIYIWY